MADQISRLRKLIDVSKEPSSDKRRQLLREVTDVFLVEMDRLNPREVEYFAEILCRLAAEVEMRLRGELSLRLADVDEAPHSLVMQLANDEIEVARPVLMHSTVLQEADLVHIAEQHSQEHLQAVSVRDHVPSAVADVIVERGIDAVLETLAGNQGAELSRQAMETMVRRAEANEGLHVPLAERADVPATAVCVLPLRDFLDSF